MAITGVNTSTSNTSAWTSAGGVEDVTNQTEIQIYWACATESGTVSAKPAGTNSDCGYTMTEYSGVACTTPQVGTIQNDIASGAETGFTTGTITAAQTHNLLFGVWASEEADQTITWGSGWSMLENITSHIHKTAEKVITDGSGNYTLSGTFNETSNKWISAFVMFKAASN